MDTAVVLEEACTRHFMGSYHPESPQRLAIVGNLLNERFLNMGDDPLYGVRRLKARKATHEEVGYVHQAEYIMRIAETKGKEQTLLDPDTIASAETYEAALFAAGGSIVLAGEIARARAKNGFAFVRPPGHHAERDRAQGFCIFNNVAIAAEYLLRSRLANKIAIVDFDVHHGNGTQNHFYHRRDVFYISTHAFPFYPGSGAAYEIGEGEGEGYTLNIPMHSDSTDDDYLSAYFQKVIPALKGYVPDFIIVSAGFDLMKDDPIGCMRVSSGGIRKIVESLVNAASELCSGRIMFVLEGGYSLSELKEGVAVVLDVLIAARV